MIYAWVAKRPMPPPNNATLSFHTQRSGVRNPSGFEELRLHVVFVGLKPTTGEGTHVPLVREVALR